MDIAATSIVMSQMNVMNQANISVMKMAMNTENQSAAQMTQMMGNFAVDPSLGSSLDVSA
ncbi:YjfB family protein [Clostridium scatologenes]|uniref:Motility protein n=1 Tax=Clostridium scatologenes TaxID=1548 RepID=A0A0E3GRG7_CLOSL|nr:YjfB family protein [Clostridium scatologenes]AKA70291.1 hypothetical protein CSCA_3166 [Clostridium scatologenes]